MPKYQMIFNQFDKPTITLMEHLCRKYDLLVPMDMIPAQCDTPVLIADGQVIAYGAINIYNLLEYGSPQSNNTERPPEERLSPVDMIKKMQDDEREVDKGEDIMEKSRKEMARREGMRKLPPNYHLLK